MADKVVIEAEVKSNIGDVKKDTTAAISEFEIMGVSLNKVKAGFVSIGNQAKVMFGSIKAGLLSTGIGAFIVAIGSLATYFTQTKKGAELLEKALAGVGAAAGVIVDRISTFGGAIVKLFKGDAKGALEGVKATFKDIGTEISNDTKRAIELKEAFQELRDSQRDLNVETAQQRAEIERLKLIAEDVTKSTRERLAAAKEAFQIENDLLARRIANAEEDLRIQMESMELTKVDGDNSAAELDRKAELEINLADIKAESLTKQIELNNKINAITAEGAAKAAEALQAQKDADAARMGVLTEMPRLAQDVTDSLIQADNNYFLKVKENAEKRKNLEEGVLQAKKNMINMGLNIAAQAGEKGVMIAKALAVRQAAMAGYEAVQNTFVSAAKNPITTLFPPYPYIMAAGAGVFSALQIKGILSETPMGGGGGGTGGGAGGMASGVSERPAPQMMSGAFDLSGGMQPEPVKAFVVTDEMTNSQNQLANIRRRSTI
tara:strand:+ start:485 stop:1954 length:1470 start_codon:yes stop_codon:yes gene_type:complete